MFPLINTRVKRKPDKWINDSIKMKIEERGANKTIWLEDKSSIEVLLVHKESKKEVSKLIRNEKANYFHDKQQKVNKKRNSRKTCNIINNLTKDIYKTKIFQINASQTASFNDYFSKVGSNTFKKVTGNSLTKKSHLPPQDLINECNRQLIRPESTDISIVIKNNKKLTITNSYDIDEIPCKYIKYAIQIIALYITVNVNTSIVAG